MLLPVFDFFHRNFWIPRQTPVYLGKKKHEEKCFFFYPIITTVERHRKQAQIGQCRKLAARAAKVNHGRSGRM